MGRLSTLANQGHSKCDDQAEIDDGADSRCIPTSMCRRDHAFTDASIRGPRSAGFSEQMVLVTPVDRFQRFQ